MLNHVTFERRRISIPVLDHKDEILLYLREIGPGGAGEDDEGSRQAVRPHGPLVGVVPMGPARLRLKSDNQI